MSRVLTEYGNRLAARGETIFVGKQIYTAIANRYGAVVSSLATTTTAMVGDDDDNDVDNAGFISRERAVSHRSSSDGIVERYHQARDSLELQRFTRNRVEASNTPVTLLMILNTYKFRLILRKFNTVENCPII